MVKEQIQVLLYRTDSCIWCHKAMEWLKAHKIKFTEKKVDHDDNLYKEYLKQPIYPNKEAYKFSRTDRIEKRLNEIIESRK